jgi:hypothetical protein
VEKVRLRGNALKIGLVWDWYLVERDTLRPLDIIDFLALFTSPILNLVSNKWDNNLTPDPLQIPKSPSPDPLLTPFPTIPQKKSKNFAQTP